MTGTSWPVAFWLVASLVPGGLAAQAADSTPPERLAARQWYRDAKFGMFIHWGVYSLLGQGEWVMQNRDPGRTVRVARRDVQPREVRRAGVGLAREGRRGEVHHHHLAAPRRLLDVRHPGDPVQRRRLDAFQA